MTDRATQHLPVFLPGNNRNFEEVEGIATIDEKGEVHIRLHRAELADMLVDQWEQGILTQLAFDFRLPPDERKKIASQFQQEYYDEETLSKVYLALSEVITPLRLRGRTVQKVLQDCVSSMQNKGIKFREVR